MDRSDPIEYSERRFWDMLVQRDPREALSEIERIIAEGSLSAQGRTLAESARSRSLFELGRLDEAVEAASRATTDAARLGAELRRSIVMSSTVIFAESGSVDMAVAALEGIEAESSGLELARMKVQKAYVLHQAGRLNDAADELTRSQAMMEDHAAEPRDLVRVHQNRGLVLLQQGNLDFAEVEFGVAAEIAADAGMTAAHAQSVANLAVLHGRARRLRRSLEAFDRSAELFEAAGNPARTVAHAELDRAEVMMHSGLPADAARAAQAAVDLIEPSGNLVMIGDALLLLARAELEAGMIRRSSRAAERAATTFRNSDRTQMLPLANSLLLQGDLVAARSVDVAVPVIDRAVAVSADLRRAGWDARADDLAVARIRAARRWRQLDRVRGDLERLRIGLADGRRDTLLSGWWAEALVSLADARLDDAERACHEGLSVLDEIVAETTNLEERSAAMQIGRDVSELLIQVAVGRSDAETVLSAAEGTRARALHDELARSGRHEPLSLDGAHRLRTDLAERLDGAVLVEWFVIDERVGAVVFTEAGARLVDVGDRAEVTRAVDLVTAWLDIAVAEPDGPSGRAASAMRRLDDMLVRPLCLPGTADVVMVPIGMLHRVPWCGLPDLTARSFTLVPSAQLWLEASRHASTVSSISAVIGPDAAETDRELAALQRAYPTVEVATGTDATAVHVRSVFERVDVVHIAAHGQFRSDRPLLSTLRFGDGEATLDATLPERVRSQLVILSSCEGGAQGTTDGSEVLGLSSVLLARGAAAVLAPLTAVRELECAEFVAEVHRELAAGTPFAAAVAAVRSRWLADDDLSRWAVASSFTCFGSGAVTVATDGDAAVLLEG